MSQPANPLRAARIWTRLRPIAVKLVKVALWILVVLVILRQFGWNVFDLAAGTVCLWAAVELNEDARTRTSIVSLQILLVLFGLALAVHGARALGWLGKGQDWKSPRLN